MMIMAVATARAAASNAHEDECTGMPNAGNECRDEERLPKMIRALVRDMCGGLAHFAMARHGPERRPCRPRQSTTPKLTGHDKTILKELRN